MLAHPQIEASIHPPQEIDLAAKAIRDRCSPGSRELFQEALEIINSMDAGELYAAIAMMEQRQEGRDNTH